MDDNTDHTNSVSASASASASTSTSARPTITPTDDLPTTLISPPCFSIFPGPFVNWMNGIFVSSSTTATITTTTTPAATTNDDDDDDDDGNNLPPVPTPPSSQSQPPPQPQSSTIMNSKMDSITQEVSVLKITVANQADTTAAATAAAAQQVQATTTMAATQQASSSAAARNESVPQQRPQQQVPTFSFMRNFDEEEQQIIRNALYGSGHADDVVAHSGTDSVQRSSMHTLKPRRWLNDEIIHYYYLLLSKRDEKLCMNETTRQRSHFFKSFFITKILNEGNASCNGKYEYRNVKRWSKKVPGKDIFTLDKIFFPINMGRMHWIAAVIFMKKKRIEIFDSLGSDGDRYLAALFRYLQDEHRDKKKRPLPDAAAWELIPTQQKTPRQRNGYDCGVFTCMFADFLSTDTALVFTQHHMNQCRQRIAHSIMTGQAIV